MVLIYTQLEVSLTIAILVNVLMFVGIFSRMIPSQALMSAIPTQSARLVQRGELFPAAALRRPRVGARRAIIAQNADGSLRHFDSLGYIVVATSILSLIAMYFVQK